MAHLTEETLYILHFDGVALSAEQEAHLQFCVACRTRSEAMATFARSFAVARRSLPSADALSRAHALYTHVQSQGSIQRVSHWVRARLSLDTRLSTANQGVRGVATSYRMLYTTDETDIELAIEPVSASGFALVGRTEPMHRSAHKVERDGLRRIDGELLPLDESADLLPALVQLERQDALVLPLEISTDEDGRFYVDSVNPGIYRMWVAFSGDLDVLIDGLEIA